MLKGNKGIKSNIIIMDGDPVAEAVLKKGCTIFDWYGKTKRFSRTQPKTARNKTEYNILYNWDNIIFRSLRVSKIQSNA